MRSKTAMRRVRRVFLSDSEDEPDPVPDLKGIYSDSRSDGEAHEDIPSLVFSEEGEDSGEDDDFVPTPAKARVNPPPKSREFDIINTFLNEACSSGSTLVRKMGIGSLTRTPRTKLGMIGYCRKNHESPNNADWKKNVAPSVMEQKGDDLHLDLGKGDLEGRRELTENNTMAKADIFVASR
ncbi:hypothetical protein CYMTET_33967 [Cymbomonas tetramitiformis]|uniref:Uncharacterized protein n=1 Tax=Cymbomonas tetramitiformis TaxID=36881 RepID=A0AAE0KQN3_9CHLO|nr:hypothetical protein CYMTET_33967 [Cymbomonas tetramitiformis]